MIYMYLVKSFAFIALLSRTVASVRRGRSIAGVGTRPTIESIISTSDRVMANARKLQSMMHAYTNTEMSRKVFEIKWENLPRELKRKVVSEESEDNNQPIPVPEIWRVLEHVLRVSGGTEIPRLLNLVRKLELQEDEYNNNFKDKFSLSPNLTIAEMRTHYLVTLGNQEKKQD